MQGPMKTFYINKFIVLNFCGFWATTIINDSLNGHISLQRKCSVLDLWYSCIFDSCFHCSTDFTHRLPFLPWPVSVKIYHIFNLIIDSSLLCKEGIFSFLYWFEEFLDARCSLWVSTKSICLNMAARDA